ncbi:Eco57I restriction-modification methylase domain-containing protein [Romboutsia sedimentorum]|uniref:Eco57I restriction-modification methylase domain-containing protein n=1 Tax=Romboutsia sedimentorum TaxID=1368474 RepID=UPI0024DEB816|nr:Eco57I restriction-modification methylase domain-containing protein [Romboutsia sedimentorum]MDK2585015.1 Eco57I restriction-modification methylase domain-containing protein [Romboutsia sedimentorum]
MSRSDYKTFESKLIYIFAIQDERHEGLLKVGDTIFSGNPYDKEEIENAAKKRIDQYTVTANIEYELLYVDLAITKKGEYFRDYDVHNVLKRSGIETHKSDDKRRGREWFKLNLNTAKNAIEAVKEGRNALNSEDITEGFTPILFRPEQKIAIEETLKSIKDSQKSKGKDKSKKKLWNAKMRFGKTLTALQVAKEAEFKKTIIITHRPVVSDGWFEDFSKIFQNTEYIFGSKDKGENLATLIKKGKSFVYFASMQDLRGSTIVGGNFSKNDLIFNTKWDFVIVDEAHEGNLTERAKRVHKNIERTFTLELSGTPFNLIEEYDNEDDIYTWDYVMEQKAKDEWSVNNFGDSNPYESLPKLSMFTYQLDKSFRNKKYVEVEDKAFNFKEFFCTYDEDEANVNKRGKFIHEEDVCKFLDLITKKDDTTNFPFSTEYYRTNLKNTLWLVPGVAEAKALSELMKSHVIFGNFEIVNVAGDGDDEDENENALQKVKNAIGINPDESYTITITCGKLTTGVSIPAWTGVMMLSNTSSASTYLQTAFRVQTPANIAGKMKTNCYVFDFAPDRTLKMVAQAARLNTKAGRLNSQDQKIAMGEFLNYCSIISLDDSKMEEINVETLLRQLKKASAERVANNGFDDMRLYNDELLRLDEVDIEDFNNLKAIIGESKQDKKPLDVTINNQGFDDGEWEQAEKAEKKTKNQRTDEEEAALEKMKQLRKQRDAMISVLRGISIRIPMMVYGANIDYDKEITVKNFADIVDDISWKEFMPDGVTKELWKKFIKYYDNDIFIEAGLKIRRKAKAADESKTIKERIIKIAEIFKTFKNPDKETVLTSWNTVNRHITDTIGGECFFDDTFEVSYSQDESTRFIDIRNYENKSILNKESKVLEINSKSGLYPLLAAYSIYSDRVKTFKKRQNKNITNDTLLELWEKTLHKNIYVLAKTPMAKSITERTLRGYSNKIINVEYYQNITDDVKINCDKFSSNVQVLFKERGGDNLKFDVVIGNPPYQEMDGGAQASASPIYQNFVQAAKKLNPSYISLIMPSRWYTGGKGLDSFRDEMLNDEHIRELHDWLTPEDIFPSTNIRGGVCYFLWDSEYNNKESLTRVVTHENNEVVSDVIRPMKIDDIDVFIRDFRANAILMKIFNNQKNTDNDKWITEYVSPRKPFGFGGNFTNDSKFHDKAEGLSCSIKCYGKGIVGYIECSDIKVRTEWIDKWKVYTARANNVGTELSDDNFNTIIGEPNTVCTETYIAIGVDLNLDENSVNNLSNYLQTKFSRYLHSLAKTSHDAPRGTYRFIPMQDFSNSGDIDWSVSTEMIDRQLYEKYGLSNDEIEFIESKIKPM